MTREQIDLQGRVWLRRELLTDGLTDRDIQRRLRSGAWHRVRQGAYCETAFWQSLSAADRHRLLCRAVLRTANPTTVLTHVSAAVERGVPVWGISLAEVHTTRPDGAGGRREAGVVHHRGALPEEHVEVVNGVRVTVAPRCAIEVCVSADVEPALVTVDGLIHSGQTTLVEIASFAHDMRDWPESLTTRVVLHLADGRKESALESRASYFFWASHLPKPEPQVEVFDESGRVCARVDFAWVDLGVFLEADGKLKYDLFRRPDETLEAFLMREKRREERICMLTGWVCIRIGWADLQQPELLARRIRAVLASRIRPGA